LIRDWLKISEASFHAGKMVPMFHATSIEKYLQRIYFMKYLTEYYNRYEAISKYKHVCLNGDIERQMFGDEVNQVYEAALKQKWPSRKETFFYITQQEIDFINKINAPREFRLYILGILIYGKYTKQQIGVPSIGTRERGYAYYLTTHADDFNIGKQRATYMAKLMADRKVGHNIRFVSRNVDLKNSLLRVPKTIVSFQADWINWDADDGYAVMDIERDGIKLADMIQDWRVVCPNCSKEFLKSKKAKTSMCPACYEEYRRLYKNKKAKEHRNKENVDRNNKNTD